MNTPDASLAVFAALAAHLHEESDEALTSQAIVTRMKDLIPGADQVSLTVRTSRRQHRTLASSGDVAASADALQHELAEGPCIEVTETGGWLRSADVLSDGRWPAWGPRVADLGVGSMISVSVAGHGGPRGALNVYSSAVDDFADRDTIDLALIYAMHATAALATARMAGNLQTAVSSRHSIGIAQGMLMERYDIDQDRSFELLRRLSSTSNVKLRDVASRIVETRDLPAVVEGSDAPDDERA